MRLRTETGPSDDVASRSTARPRFDMTVRSIMTANPACCTAATPLHEVARLMLDNDCGQIPVVDDLAAGKPVGVITDRDIAVRMIALGRNPLDASARDCMTTPCISVSHDTSVADCCAVMEASKIRRVPVVDADGRVCGIVALADVVRGAESAATVDVVREVSSAN